jgi:hypothetical protein
MISAKDAVAELLSRFDAGDLRLTEGDVASWTNGAVVAEERIYDEVAAELARGYAERRYAFEFCDRAMNALYAVVVAGQMRTPQPPWPTLFGRVYEAFDAGEYHRHEDKSDDPVAEHTDKMIATIVSQL